MATNGDGVDIPIRVDAGGVAPGVAQTVTGLKQVEAATTAAGQAARQQGEATTAAGAESAAAAKTAADAAAAYAAAQEKLGTVGALTATRLANLKITSEQLTDAALATNSSLEATAQAMIQIANAKASDEIARVKAQLEGMQAQGAEATQTIDDGNKDAVASSEDLSAQLEWMGDDLADNTQKGARMVEEFGSMRESRRIAIELFEAFAGGGETISGVTGLLRTFILTSEALSPELQAITAIGLALAGVIALHGKTEKSAEDAAGGEDKLSDAVGRLQDAAEKTGLDVLNKQLAEYLRQQGQLLAQQKEVDDGDARRAKRIGEEIDATAKLTISKLEAAKAQELAGAHGKTERDAIEAKYANLEAGARGASEAEKFQREQADLRAQIAAKEREKTWGLSANEDAEGRLRALQAKADQATAKVADAGYVPNALGAFTDDQIKAQQAKATAAADAAQKAQEAANPSAKTIIEESVPGVVGENARRGQRVKEDEARDAQAKAVGESTLLADLKDAKTAREALKDGQEKLTQELQKNSASIDKANDERDQLLAQYLTNNTTRQNQIKENEAKGTTQGAKEKKDATDDAYADRETKRKQKIDDLDAQIKATADEAIKAALEKTKAGIEAEGEKDKANSQFAAGSIDKDTRDQMLDHAKNISTNADSDVAKQNAAAEKKTDAQQIEQIIGNAQASGNKALIEAVRRTVESDKGNTTKELADLLLLNVQKQDARWLQTQGALSDIRRHLEKHDGHLDSVTNGNNN